MAIKHQTIEAVRSTSLANTASVTYNAGGTIPKGAPVVFSSGLVVEATDADAGAAGPIVGVTEHAGVITNPMRLVPPLEAQRFIGSLTDITASVASDGGTHALAVADIGTVRELHKDDTTGKWVLGATGGANAMALIVALVDKVGATTNDAPSFGQVGTAGPNSGKALVEFIFQTADTIYA